MTVLHFTAILVGLLSLACLLGYGIGRRIGALQGRQAQTIAAPLALRMQAYESGKCPVCGQLAPDHATMCQKG